MDWTGTRLRISERTGILTLTPEIAGPYRQSHQGVTDFVASYAHAAIERHRLERILVYDPMGECLGEVLPPPPKRDV
jgi:hypothetical protein